MLIVRLQRVGRKNDPSFRVVVVDHKEAAKTGKVIEIVGSHDPRVDRTELKADRITDWISKGAKVSDTVHNLLIKKGITTGQKINVVPERPAEKAAEVLMPEAVATPTSVEEVASSEAAVETLAEEPKEELAPSEAEGVLTEKID